MNIFGVFAENSKTPYSATVMINDMEYGTGCAISKKLAKSEAGMSSVLFPDPLTCDRNDSNERLILDLSVCLLHCTLSRQLFSVSTLCGIAVLFFFWVPSYISGVHYFG